MTSVFASIGLAGLIPALTLRKNTKEYVPVKRLDESASGCFSCPFCGRNEEACASCPSKIFYTETKVVYRNEKSRYGYKPPLKRNALVLYLYLHFLNPDANGYVASLEESEAAAVLGCSERTVENNMRLLQRNGYVAFAGTQIPGRLQVFITDYGKAFLKAEEGGRGYLRISRELFESLSALPDVNSLRLALRTYAEESMTEMRQGRTSEKSVGEVKSRLPEYVTKKKLREILESEKFSSMFEVLRKGKALAVFVRKKFSRTRIEEMIKEECLAEIRKYEKAVNKKGGRKTPKLVLTSAEESDVCGISLRLPIESVLEGLRTFYEIYVKKNLPYSNAGALVRTFAAAHAEYGFVP